MKTIKSIKYLSILSVISLSGIGYSTWVLQPFFENKINVSTGNVSSLSDFIVYDNTIRMFEFSKYGLISNETFVYTGNIEIGFTIINISSLSQYLGTNNLTLNITFESMCVYDLNFNIFRYLNSTDSCKYSISEGLNNINYSNNFIASQLNDKTAVSFDISINDITSYSSNQIYLSLLFPFDFSSVSNSFNSSIYTKITNNGLTFYLSVKNL